MVSMPLFAPASASSPLPVGPNLGNNASGGHKNKREVTCRYAAPGALPPIIHSPSNVDEIQKTNHDAHRITPESPETSSPRNAPCSLSLSLSLSGDSQK